MLLRESYRVGKQTKKRTLANLSKLPPEIIEVLRRALRGETLLPAHDAFVIERSRPHGYVAAVLGTLRKLGLDEVLASRRSRERDLVSAMLGRFWVSTSAGGRRAKPSPTSRRREFHPSSGPGYGALL